jgi:hypothetical protein
LAAVLTLLLSLDDQLRNVVNTDVETNHANQTIEELALKCDSVSTQGERCQSNKVRIKVNALKLRMRALASKQRLSLFWQLLRLRAVSTKGDPTTDTVVCIQYAWPRRWLVVVAGASRHEFSRMLDAWPSIANRGRIPD